MVLLEVDRATREGILIMGNAAEPKGLDPHIVSGVLESNIISTRENARLALWADFTDLRDWVIVCEATFTVFQRGPYLLEQQITILVVY